MLLDVCCEQLQDWEEDAARLLRRTSFAVLPEIAEVLLRAFSGGHRLFVAGNGGSASDADHIAAEFVGRYRGHHLGLPAVALTNHVVSTALANDYCPDRIFADHLRALARSGDVLWVLSTSGASENILRAADQAALSGCELLAFLGPSTPETAGYWEQRPGAKLLWVPSSDTARIQEVHRFCYHCVVDLVRLALKDQQ